MPEQLHSSKSYRILLKLSGERLSLPSGFGICQAACQQAAQSLIRLRAEKNQLAIVIGGGNIFRGINAKNLQMARTPADQIGMLATMMNGLALQQAIQALGCPARVLSALDCPKVVESYTWRNALQYLQAGEIIVFVGGTGNPYFTTDTAAAMRASEIGADMLLKATKVDGVYNKDPLKYPDAIRYQKLSYSQMLAEKLEVMDAASIALCMNNKIPVKVFHMGLLEEEQIDSVLSDPAVGTLIN